MDERIHKTILITPLEKPEGITILSYKGLVMSSVVEVIPPHLEILTLISSAKNKPSPISSFVSKLVGKAILSLEEKAKMLGANAVLGLRINVQNLGWGRILVVAYGTAAEVKE